MAAADICPILRTARTAALVSMTIAHEYLWPATPNHAGATTVENAARAKQEACQHFRKRTALQSTADFTPCNAEARRLPLRLNTALRSKNLESRTIASSHPCRRRPTTQIGKSSSVPAHRDPLVHAPHHTSGGPNMSGTRLLSPAWIRVRYYETKTSTWHAEAGTFLLS